MHRAMPLLKGMIEGSMNSTAIRVAWQGLRTRASQAVVCPWVQLYDQYLQTREALDNCYLCR